MTEKHIVRISLALCTPDLVAVIADGMLKAHTWALIRLEHLTDALRNCNNLTDRREIRAEMQALLNDLETLDESIPVYMKNHPTIFKKEPAHDVETPKSIPNPDVGFINF